MTSVADQLQEAINNVHTANSKLTNLNATLTQQKAYLEEVVAENAEKSKVAGIIKSLEEFDASKIKNCAIVSPITPGTIEAFKLYQNQLSQLNRYDSDAQHNIDLTSKEISSTQAYLEELHAKISYLKCLLKREQEDVKNKLESMNRLLMNCEQIQPK